MPELVAVLRMVCFQCGQPDWHAVHHPDGPDYTITRHSRTGAPDISIPLEKHAYVPGELRPV